MTQTLCSDRNCLLVLRDGIESLIAQPSLRVSPEEQPRAVWMTCWGIAVLATDPTALGYLAQGQDAVQWAQGEDYFASLARTFPMQIEALRGHLTPEEQGVGAEVPEWVMAMFVYGPIAEEVQHG
jgi:hypothetical protein